MTQIQGLSCRVEDIDIILNLIVSAYLLFDSKGVGYIDRTSVTNLICESNGKKNAMLSQQRWNEMVSFLLIFYWFFYAPSFLMILYLGLGF